jgi:hypothetical protein
MTNTPIILSSFNPKRYEGMISVTNFFHVIFYKIVSLTYKSN